MPLSKEWDWGRHHATIDYTGLVTGEDLQLRYKCRTVHGGATAWLLAAAARCECRCRHIGLAAEEMGEIAVET